MAGEKRLVHRVALGDLIAQRQHQRHVGIGANRDPVGVDERRAVIAHRADINNRRAFGRQLLQRRFQAVLACAARRHLGIFQRQPAEGNEDFRVLHHLRPVSHAPGQRHIGADHIGQKKLRRSPAVIALLIDAAAALKIEATDQGARVVDAARRRPAVRAVENA